MLLRHHHQERCIKTKKSQLLIYDVMLLIKQACPVAAVYERKMIILEMQ
jgi:hypothetical protein